MDLFCCCLCIPTWKQHAMLGGGPENEERTVIPRQESKGEII